MPKDVKGDILGFLKFQFVAKYQKIEEGRFGDTKFFEKKLKGDPSDSSDSANAQKSSWLKQGLEPVTDGFSLNRLKSVLKSGTYRVSSVV